MQVYDYVLSLLAVDSPVVAQRPQLHFLHVVGHSGLELIASMQILLVDIPVMTGLDVTQFRLLFVAGNSAISLELVVWMRALIVFDNHDSTQLRYLTQFLSFGDTVAVWLLDLHLVDSFALGSVDVNQ